jgi:GNAT superfamily N-acetyltransferase
MQILVHKASIYLLQMPFNTISWFYSLDIFCLFDNNVLISVVSTFITEESMQFRKFATLESEQGKGYGSLLLTHIIQFAKDEHCKRMWCNARCNASAFYAKFGFTETEQKFHQDGHNFVIMEIYL